MITFYTLKGSRTQGALRTSVPSNLIDKVSFKEILRKDLPSSCDVVVQAGDGPPSKQQHILARNVAGSMLVCLPEAGAWLVQQIERAISSGARYRIADAGLATTSKLFD